MSNYINNIEDCKLEIFRLVIAKQDYKLLLLIGDFNKEEAIKQWYILYDEYNDAINSKSVNVKFEFSKQLEILKNEYLILKNSLFLVVEIHKLNLINNNNNYDISEYITIINNYGYNFDIKKGVGKESERVNNQLKNYKTKITRIINQIEDLSEQTKDWSFDSTIGVVEKFMGFQMGEKTTVKRFTTYLNQLINSNGK